MSRYEFWGVTESGQDQVIGTMMVRKAPAWQVEGDGMVALSVRCVFQYGSEAGARQVAQQE
jgi:hypothetical protein